MLCLLQRYFDSQISEEGIERSRRRVSNGLCHIEIRLTDVILATAVAWEIATALGFPVDPLECTIKATSFTSIFTTGISTL
jgi:hypothetical protein